MPERRCTGCGAPLRETDVACPSCGRLHLYPRYPRWTKGGGASLSRMVIWTALLITLLAVLGWILVTGAGSGAPVP
jgi:hypothetical protein